MKEEKLLFGRFIVHSATDQGPIRENNEDAIGSFVSEPKECLLLVTCDGMGGHSGGGIASTLALEAVRTRFFEECRGLDLREALCEALFFAHEVIGKEALFNPDLSSMGTTCSALAIKQDRAFLAHIGDSRIYRHRKGGIEQLTKDHTMVQKMVELGVLTKEEGFNHPDSNILSQCLGCSRQMEPDLAGPLSIGPEDLFLICSDGLHGSVDDERILEILDTCAPEKAITTLITTAIDAGSTDNISVQILSQWH